MNRKISIDINYDQLDKLVLDRMRECVCNLIEAGDATTKKDLKALKRVVKYFS